MKNIFNKETLSSAIDNRFFQILFLPLSIWNTYQSWKAIKAEHALFEQTINENDSFFTAIATMNFEVDDKDIFTISSTMEVDKIFTIQDIQNIARETIIKTIMEYVRDESLLGIVLVKCTFIDENTKVKIAIQPAHFQLYENDRKDLIQSIKVNLVLLGIIGLIFGAIKYTNLF